LGEVGRGIELTIIGTFMKNILCACCIFIYISGWAQIPNYAHIDSFRNEIKKFHIRKKVLGNRADPLMDTFKANELIYIGWEYLKCNNDSGMAYASQSLDLFEQIHYKKGVGYVYACIGAYKSNIGKFSEAIEYFEKSLAYRPDQKENIGIYRNLVTNFSNLSQKWQDLLSCYRIV